MIKENVVQNIKKEWQNVITSAKDALNAPECIDTGSIQLNQALGINGFPLGRIIEIYGNESSGKTTIALQAILQAQKSDKKAMFIDVEHSLDLNYVKSIGIDTNKLLLANPLTGEQVFSIIEYAIKEKLANIIVVDSVAGMLPQVEIENSIEDHQLGAHARLMSRGLRKIQTILANEPVCIIFLNQVREKIGVFFGNPETTTGGKALKFFSSIRIETRKSDLIKDNNNKIGIKSKLTIVKNKLAPPLKTAYIDIYFNSGYDFNNEIIEFSIEYNVISKNGSWYSYNNEKIAQGREQLKKYLQENPETFNKIKEETFNKLDYHPN